VIAPWIFACAAFLLGLLFGSFLNVCIARLPHGESIVKPPSHCPNCKHSIRWYDNIPVLSWLILRTRCRDCNQRISVLYPLVELTIGIWFSFVTLDFFLPVLFDWVASDQPFHFERLLSAISIAILGFLLIGLLVMDWQSLRLPDAFTLTGTAIALFLLCTQAIFLGPTEDQVVLHSPDPIRAAMAASHGNVFLTGPEALIGGRLVAILAAAGILLAIRAAYKLLRNREGMGLGDVKLIAMITAFLGFWPAILALFLGTLAASFYAAILLAMRRANRLTRLPFGSFLALGGLAAALFGPALIAKYTSLFQ
jgi:leader peptidase (prepilin peptidase)/N-methyltransferase